MTLACLLGIIIVWAGWVTTPGPWWARLLLALLLAVPMTVALWPWQPLWRRGGEPTVTERTDNP